MDNGIYIALSREMALFRDMDTTANNVANMNTSGYTANRLLFTSYMVNEGKRGSMDFANDVSTWRDTALGAPHATGNPLDVALGGDGYFVVDSPLGRRYTRAGSFTINAEGRLVTQEGYAVLDANSQPILFNDADKAITIGSAGNITVDGEDRATLGVVTFDNPQDMQRMGERMFSTDQSPKSAPDPRVMQGVLENSNVQPVLEMTHMIDVSRSVSNTAKFIEVMYDLQRKTANVWTQQS